MGERLQTLRKNHKLTQKQVAERIGVSKSVLSGYELEDRHPSYDVLLKIATLYNVTCDFLIGKSSERTLDVTGLNESEIASIAEVVRLMKESHDDKT